MHAREHLPAPPRRFDTMFTPGQRWSTGIVLALALALAAAQPHVRGGLGGLFGAPAIRPSDSSPSAGPPATTAPNRDLEATVVPVSEDAAAPGTATATDVPVPPGPPEVVALVRANDGAPGRDDATIAAAFLETAAFDPTVMTVPETADAAFCGQVAAAGSVAVAGVTNDPELRDCLAAAGVLLVGFDTLGSSDSVVSTRRGPGEALDDLAAWARRSGALAGNVGVVATTESKSVVEAAVGRMKAAGISVAATAYVADSGPGATSQGVRDFASAGVQTVVFAVPVAHQQAWVAQQSLLSVGVRYVVADAYDAVANETYPAVFDGSLALTSVRVPWFARDNGPTPAQQQCQSRWEQNAAPPVTLGSAELVKVFAWCQHVALLTAALEAYGTTGDTFAGVLRSVRFTSPLTSDVGPLAGGRFGPTQDAAVIWQAGCGCWKQRTPFADR